MDLRAIIIAGTCCAIMAIGLLAERTTPPPSTHQSDLAEKPHPRAKATKKKRSAKQESVTLTHETTDASPLPRNPFIPEKSPSRARGRPLLEQIELTELRLVAIAKDINGSRAASVEDRDGIGFMLRAGTRLGPHGAYVKEIRQDGIMIVEPHSDHAPVSAARERFIALHPGAS